MEVWFRSLVCYTPVDDETAAAAAVVAQNNS